MIALQPPQIRYIQNEIYSNYSNVNGKEHYAEIEKTNNNGQIRIIQNIDGNKTEYYVLRPHTFSDNITEKPYSLYSSNTKSSNSNKHKKRQRIRTKDKKSKRVASIVPNKKNKNKSVKKQRQIKNV
jgi:hypothetical protein